MKEESRESRRDRIQKAFDAQADELGLEVEASSFSEGEHYGVGFIPLLGKRMAVAVPAVEAPEDITEADRDAVIHIVKGWESVYPDDVATEWPNYVTDPVMLVDPSGVVRIGAEEMEASPKDKMIEETMEKYPVCNPREVKLDDVNVVFVGQVRAGLTGTLSETMKDGTTQTTKINHILIKTLGGWRITVITKELVH